MKSLTQAGGQLIAVWKQLGLNQRVSVVLAGGLAIAALGGIVYWSGRVNYALLYGKLDDSDVSKVVSVLEELKVPHKTGASGGAIYVPADKVHSMRMQLASRGVGKGDGVGFEIFDKPNFGVSDFIQRANFIRAIQGELARTISQLDQLEAARVMIVMPENRLLIDNGKRATASVFIKVKGGADLPPSAISAIRFLVANSVEGLTPNQVSVVDNRGNVLSENTESDSIAGLTASQLAARRTLEQYLAKKTEGMLQGVLGPGQAIVRVSADINFDSSTRTEERFDPEGQVLRTSKIDDENTDSGTAAPGGAAGASGNLLGDTNSLAAAPASNRTKKKVSTTQYEINRTINNLTQTAGGVKRVTAAVFVAARYEGEGAARKIAPRPPEELDKLRRLVQSALGLQADNPERKDEITLEEMPFSEGLPEVAQTLGQMQKRQFWWDQGQKLIYPILALGVIVMFWRTLRRTPVETVSVSRPSTAGASGVEGESASIAALNRLVREKPDDFSQAIQTWLGRENTPASRAQGVRK